MRLFAYDVTNSATLPVVADNSGDLPNLKGKMQFKILPSSNTASVRLSLMVNTTNITAYNLIIDDVKLGPDSAISAPIVQDLGSFTPTSTWVSGATHTGKAYRIGNRIAIDVEIALTGAPTATNLKIDPHPNYPVLSTITDRLPVYCEFVETGVREYVGGGFWNGTTFNIVQAETATNNGNINHLTPFTFGNTDFVTVHIEYPVQGWSSGALISTTESFNSTQVVEAGAGSQSIPNVNQTTLTGWTEEIDTHNLFNPTTGVFTANRKGKFEIKANAAFTANATGFREISIRKNGTNVVFQDFTPSTASSNPADVKIILDLVVGDTIDVQVYQSSGATLLTRNDVRVNRLSIKALPDFSTFGVYGEQSNESAVSSIKTPTASGNWHQMVGNSLTLPSGKYKLNPSLIEFNNNATTPAYSFIAAAWFSANGTDTATLPTALSASTNIAILSSTLANEAGKVGLPISGSTGFINTGSVLITVNSTTTIYLVPFSSQTTSANARITVYPNVEKLA